jgi:hypothetical protein
MKSLNFDFHAGQLQVWNDPRRFKVVVAGRRWGKSRLAAYFLLAEALQNTDPTKHVFYIAPTFQQAKDVMWNVLMEIGHSVIKTPRSNEGTLELVNGTKIHLKGSDRPETMRGVGLRFCVIDEYADMKPDVWEVILQPALTDVMGRCVFIGTPKGRNHFWQLCEDAALMDDEWAVWKFRSVTNPFLPAAEIEKRRKTMSSSAFRQEYEATFESGSGDIFKEEWLKYGPEPDEEGEWYMAVDLAGFEEVGKSVSLASKKRLDRTALAIVKVTRNGWWVKEIQAGRWDTRETSLRILRAAKTNGVRIIGIEKGSLHNAVMPYLQEQMQRLNFFPRIQSVTHGNQIKTERIAWALQGRMEHGRILLPSETSLWRTEFEDEFRNFPSKQVHDDMLDALSYIDQIQTVSFMDYDDTSAEYMPMDSIIGY